MTITTDQQRMAMVVAADGDGGYSGEGGFLTARTTTLRGDVTGSNRGIAHAKDILGCSRRKAIRSTRINDSVTAETIARIYIRRRQTTQHLTPVLNFKALYFEVYSCTHLFVQLQCSFPCPMYLALGHPHNASFHQLPHISNLADKGIEAMRMISLGESAEPYTGAAMCIQRE
eukprot:scpid22128/ scgid19144/ 